MDQLQYIVVTSRCVVSSQRHLEQSKSTDQLYNILNTSSPSPSLKMAKDLVLITGVNGYIAAVAAKHFLDHGHSVRGTVRKAASAQAMIDGPLKDYAASGKFTIVEVPDITTEGAFDEAVKGIVQTITRTLSPSCKQSANRLHDRRNSHRPPRQPRFPLFLGPCASPARRRQWDKDHPRQRAQVRRPPPQICSRHVVYRFCSLVPPSSIHFHREGLERFCRANVRREGKRYARYRDLCCE